MSESAAATGTPPPTDDDRTVLAVTAQSIDAADPLAGLRVGSIPAPSVPDGWARVRLRTMGLNHHDL